MTKIVKNRPLPKKASVKVSIDIAVHSPGWKRRRLGDEKQVRKIITTTIKAATLPKIIQGKKLEVGVVLSDDGEIQTLNRFYRGKNKPTNVLSFTNLDSKNIRAEIKAAGSSFNLGDIVLSYETLAREAKAMDRPFVAHFTHLLVHGTLHLLKYDHESNKDAAEMERLEIKILEKMGFENPYAHSNFMA